MREGGRKLKSEWVEGGEKGMMEGRCKEHGWRIWTVTRVSHYRPDGVFGRNSQEGEEAVIVSLFA
jgi:hypothetical protein